MSLLPIAPLGVVALFAVLSALVLLVYGLKALRQHLLAGISRLVAALFLLCLAALAGLLAVGIYGYQALTDEQVAATVTIRKLAEQRFLAEFRLVSGDTKRFELAGDELYVDARILKWHSYANLLGLRTLYELDRVAGRYSLLDEEQTKARTVYALGQARALDLFALNQRFPALGLLVDAEYGSGTFRLVEEASYQISVSTSGLLIRQLD